MRFAILLCLVPLIQGCDFGKEVFNKGVVRVITSALTGGAPVANCDKPNVLVFMVDDLDQKTFDVALANNLLPNIKKHLIDRGVTFNRSYVTDSLCCPSRATFLSGQ